MAGREEIIRDMESVLSGDENNPAVISLFVGARGAGKTALLSRFAEMVESDGWIARRSAVLPGFREYFAERIAEE